MGEVYLAVQTGIGRFEKPLALKLLLPHLSDRRRAVRMFLDEARLAARMNHPNVTSIFDVGVLDGRYFMAMELVHGISLARLIEGLRQRRTRPAADLVAAVGAALCDGLHHAHEQRDADGRALGLVHRDVTPHNVLISVDGVVKLADFGIARAHDTLDETAKPRFLGKLAYLPPEQLRGDPVDRRADLYAAGLTLVHFSTLEQPLQRSTREATVDAILGGGAAPALEETPSALREALAAALAQEPWQRPGDARALRALLPPVAADALQRLGDLVRAVCGDELRQLSEQTHHALELGRGTESVVPATRTERFAGRPEFAAPRRGWLLVAALGLALGVTAGLAGFHGLGRTNATEPPLYSPQRYGPARAAKPRDWAQHLEDAPPRAGREGLCEGEPAVKPETEGVTASEGETLPMWVEVVSGASAGLRARLESGTLFVGSAPECDLVLEDRSVSRRHLSLELLDGRVRVRDLGSRNGVSYLGARVTEAIVPPGATFTLGRSALTVRAVLEPDIEPSPNEFLDGLWGRSVAMRRVFTRIEKLARADTTVLFAGESGTGKEAAAQALHRRSARAAAPFVVLECAGVGAELFESRLFGHVRGAFTGASRDQPGFVTAAGEGTLLLDEVGALPLELQPRLLRLLETRDFQPVGDVRRREATCRICASTQLDLADAVSRGAFREDLYYRLTVAVIELPPLRERREDIPLLVEHFARLTLGIGVHCSQATLDGLLYERWPGNVRELRNAVNRALTLGEWRASADAASHTAHPTYQSARGRVLDAFERDYLSALLKRHADNVSAAAREAGLARSAFYRLIGRHRLGTPSSS
jgi:DNA-binding NtrC family response regulator